MGKSSIADRWVVFLHGQANGEVWTFKAQIRDMVQIRETPWSQHNRSLTEQRPKAGSGPLPRYLSASGAAVTRSR